MKVEKASVPGSYKAWLSTHILRGLLTFSPYQDQEALVGIRPQSAVVISSCGANHTTGDTSSRGMKKEKLDLDVFFIARTFWSSSGRCLFLEECKSHWILVLVYLL